MWIATLLLLLSSIVIDAKEDDEWILMPNGREYHSSCVYHHETSVLEDVKDLKACEHESRLGYYSDWSVYAKAVELKNHFSSLSATWVVPEAPVSSGPAGMSSVYYFPGLEDGSGTHGNASFILQPVLQYGKSGCVIDPLLWHQWHLSAYLVDGDGRAHCGPRLKVETGESVKGTIFQDQDGGWTVQAIRLKTNETSTYTTQTLNDKVVDAAYMTLEGMIIYNCDAFPAGGGVTFRDISATSSKGSNVDLKWQGEVRHEECNQKVNVLSNGDVKLEYS